MKTFTICWSEQVEYRMNVESDSPEDAKEKFLKGAFEYDNAKEDGGVFIDNSIEVFEDD